MREKDEDELTLIIVRVSALLVKRLVQFVVRILNYW